MNEHFDVAVIGGGIHGAGVAQAAACDGYSVVVLEKTAVAAGTSSRSSKLIHGGLRYLEGLDLSLVRESLQERALLLKIAPDLVHLQPFFIPVYENTARRPLTIRAGLTLYAMLSGLRRSGRYRKLGRAEWDALDGLDTTRLQVVYRYFDAQTNDVELTQAVMQSAMDLGAALYCPTEFRGAEISPDGCSIEYTRDGQAKTCSASTLVNAGGPWVNYIADNIRPAPEKTRIDLVQGTHLVLDGRLDKGCYYMEVPVDRRAIFLLPWGDRTLLGSTEHVYTGDPANVAPLDAEEVYLLNAMRHYFPGRPQKVIERFAGLRVLPQSAHASFRRSRETVLPTDNPQRPRLVSIYGGKLTGYRATARKVMRLLHHTLPERKAVARTSRLRLKPV
ncbi:MAG: FAD-dependent oxidoreductase [Gammaproteobacteria bacterium]|nr:MAG: FAD-dependent oxidoreductase [Gammaproteobacteria bacterium]